MQETQIPVPVHKAEDMNEVGNLNQDPNYKHAVEEVLDVMATKMIVVDTHKAPADADTMHKTEGDLVRQSIYLYNPNSGESTSAMFVSDDADNGHYTITQALHNRYHGPGQRHNTTPRELSVDAVTGDIEQQQGLPDDAAVRSWGNSLSESVVVSKDVSEAMLIATTARTKHFRQAIASKAAAYKADPTLTSVIAMSDLPEYIPKPEVTGSRMETVKTIGAAVGAIATTGVLVLGLSKMMEITSETAAHPMSGVESNDFPSPPAHNGIIIEQPQDNTVVKVYPNPPLPQVNQAPVVETLSVPPVVLPPRTQPAADISYNDMPGW